MVGRYFRVPCRDHPAPRASPWSQPRSQPSWATDGARMNLTTRLHCLWPWPSSDRGTINCTTILEKDSFTAEQSELLKWHSYGYNQFVVSNCHAYSVLGTFLSDVLGSFLSDVLETSVRCVRNFSVRCARDFSVRCLPRLPCHMF